MDALPAVRTLDPQADSDAAARNLKQDVNLVNSLGTSTVSNVIAIKFASISLI